MANFMLRPYTTISSPKVGASACLMSERVGAGMYGLGTPEDLQVFLARSTTNGEAA